MSASNKNKLLSCPFSPCSSHSCGKLWSREARLPLTFQDQILQPCAALIPISNPRGEIEAQVDADRSQRQWFKGQNQQHTPPLHHRHPLGKDDADRHTLMGSSWSVCGVIQTRASVSQPGCAGVQTAASIRTCADLSGYGCLSWSLW